MPQRGFLHPLAGADPAALSELWRLLRPRPWGLLPPLVTSLLTRPLRGAGIARAERAVARRSAGELDRPPLFIVGFWRSATTLLHELLALDPANATPTLADVLYPKDALSGRKLKRRLSERFLPETRGVDAVALRWNRPQEEEWALAQLGGPSLFLSFYFPRHRGALLAEALFFEGLRPQAQALWAEQHRRCLLLLAERHPDKRLVLKNPANSTKVALLAAAYPQARFVRIDRRPEEAIHSFRKMHWVASELLALRGQRAPRLGPRETAELHARVMQRLDADWAELPEARRVALRYEELTQAPLETVDALYTSLGLPLSSQARERMARFWQNEAAARTPRRG